MVWNADRVRGVHKSHRHGLWARVRENVWPSMGLRAWGRWLGLRLLRQAERPHTVALGFAVGVWVAFFPILGTHVPLAAALCWLLGGSVLAGVAGCWFGNPWTYPLMWSLSYKMGRWLLGLPSARGLLQLHEVGLKALMHDVHVLWGKVIWPTMVGGAVVGVPVAAGCYVVVYVTVQEWKRRR